MSTPELVIRPVEPGDFARLWPILEPVIREGATYPLPRAMTKAEAEDYWFAPGNRVFAALEANHICGTYYLRPNQHGGGAHVANAGFEAMQFNFVISSNDRAVKLWRSLGFGIVGTLPQAFQLPEGRAVDVYVMYRRLSPPPPQP